MQSPILRLLRYISHSHRPNPYTLSLRRCHTVPPSGTGGLELTFLGTASQGGARRYPSSLALRLHGTQSSEVWLFDCGEGALSQLQRSSMRVSLVRNIFITHLHGDHLYGLPSVVLSVLRSRIPEDGSKRMEIPLDVYGPRGIRGYLRMALGVAGFRMPMKDVLRIHELQWPEGGDFAFKEGKNRYCKMRVKQLPYEGEGREFEASEKGGEYTFDLISEGAKKGWRDEQPIKVVAAPVLHTVPTYAFCVTEGIMGRKFDKDVLRGMGIAVDGSARDVFKTWLGGGVVELEGKHVGIEDVIKKGRKPRRVCVIGDTYDASGCEHIATDCDVLVHESTMAAAQGNVARRRGHSCSVGAAGFAKRVGAKRLILNHVSVGYSERKMRAIEIEARGVFPRAFVARDLSVFSVPTEEEDGEEFVFRRFAGYASKEESRDEEEVRGGEELFGGEICVGEDECEAGGGVQWGEEAEQEGEVVEQEGEVVEEEEQDASWEEVGEGIAEDDAGTGEEKDGFGRIQIESR